MSALRLFLIAFLALLAVACSKVSMENYARLKTVEDLLRRSKGLLDMGLPANENYSQYEVNRSQVKWNGDETPRPLARQCL